MRLIISLPSSGSEQVSALEPTLSGLTAVKTSPVRIAPHLKFEEHIFRTSVGL